MIFIGNILLFVYIITLVVLLFGYQKIKIFKYEKDNPTIQFSIIIPFRNEASHLTDLLKSIEKLDYPTALFELIFVDDESTDQSVNSIKTESAFNNYRIIKNIRKSASPKKDAITEAIKFSKFDWIVTTDADCRLPENWLMIFNQFIQENNPTMIAGSVGYQIEKGLINTYQQLDNFSLQTVTIGGFGFKNPLMCNGANLAYRKDVFTEILGFEGNDSVASGDDIFLMEKFVKRDENGVQFLKNKNAVVITAAENSWSDIINQRIRWASKTSKQNNVASKFIGLIVFLMSLYLIVGIIFCLFHFTFIKFFIGFLVSKLIIDFIFSSQTAYFTKKRIYLLSYISNAIVYPFITVFVVLNSISGSYKWKGRAFKK
jgi:biofilm PGA synthesis N-glycosyltransferase PgaC